MDELVCCYIAGSVPREREGGVDNETCFRYTRQKRQCPLVLSDDAK